jgi:polyhydroxybutyrate depolymerase
MDSTTTPNPRTAVPLTHAGLDRPYLLQVPSAAGGGPVPLLLELHGRGIDAVRFDRLTGFGELAAEAGFALALPSAVGEMWNDGRNPAGLVGPDDVGYLAAVVDDAIARAPVDPRRIYVVGMSNGATMAARLVCELSDRFAAFAQVSGTVAPEVVNHRGPALSTPILSIHGTGDDYAPYDGGIRHTLKGRMVLRVANGPAMGVDDWARYWVEANGAGADPVTTILGPDTTIRTWRGSSPESEVVFYRVEGGGHTWPGGRRVLPAFMFGHTTRTFDAARVIWDFISAHGR